MREKWLILIRYCPVTAGSTAWSSQRGVTRAGSESAMRLTEVGTLVKTLFLASISLSLLPFHLTVEEGDDALHEEGPGVALEAVRAARVAPVLD